MPSIEGGGVEKNLFIITNYLAQKFRYIGLITVSKKFSFKFNRSIKILAPKQKFWDKMNRKVKYLISILLLIKEILNDRNLIVFSFQANIYCTIICKIFCIKIITRPNVAPAKWSKNIIQRKIFSFFFKLSNKVIVNSIEFKRKLKKELDVNSICIYNPLNKNEILKKSKKRSIKIFKKNKSLKIINVGRLTDQKDQITFLRGLNELKNKVNFQAVILGKGELKNNLERYINENNLEKNVKIKDYVENPYPFIRQADLFVLSSKFEGLPNVLLESLTLNKFIISSNCQTGPKEILMNGKGGFLFQVGNYRQLAQKIFIYKQNKNQSKKKLKYAVKKIYRFDFQKNLNQYFKLIKSEL